MTTTTDKTAPRTARLPRRSRRGLIMNLSAPQAVTVLAAVLLVAVRRRGQGSCVARPRSSRRGLDVGAFRRRMVNGKKAGNLVIRPGFCGDPWPAHRTCLGASVLLVDAQVVDFQLRRDRLVGEGQAPVPLPVVVDHHVQNDLHRPVFDRR